MCNLSVDSNAPTVYIGVKSSRRALWRDGPRPLRAWVFLWEKVL